MPSFPGLCLAGLSLALSLAASAQERILFVIGGSNTAGFLEADNQPERDEHRAEIDNFLTFDRNHGWGELANVLEADGFVLTQIEEDQGTFLGDLHAGAPLDFAAMDLDQYAVIVLGSNNATYAQTQADAIEDYVRRGGGLLVISDAGFGGDWADASNSDQVFLDRFGLLINQDHGTYPIRRNAGGFRDPDHPVFAGVDRIEGEGVSPITLGNPVPLMTTRVLAGLPANEDLRVNPGGSTQGSLRDTTSEDGALVIALVGSGRVAGHYDRNTFFNRNGAGTELERADNKTYARNLYQWLAENRGLPAPSSPWNAFRRYHFNEEDRAGSGIAGRADNPDGDALLNEWDAFHGFHPGFDDVTFPLLEARREGDAVILRYRRGTRFGILPHVFEASDTLADGSFTEINPDSITVTETFPRYEIAEAAFPATSDRLLLRIRLE